MPHLQTLFTERLVLESVRAAHADETWPRQDDDRMWTYFPELRPHSLEHLRTIYERREHGSPDDSQIWLNYVCRERETGKIAGEVQTTIFTGACVAYVAYAIFPEFQRKGYAREAVAALIEHVRRDYDIAQFFAEMDTRNEASYRLAESLGFVRVETHESVEHGRGLVADEYLYELTFRQ
jgi:ribosomal-protein-alanine N-acetyltransferase